jgi:hypothetical protein
VSEGLKAIADAIRDMGALSNGCTVDIQGLSKSPGLNGMKATVLQRIKMKDDAMEAYEVEIAETGEQKKLKRANLAGGRVNNGAISSINLLKNDISMEQAKALVIILKEHPTLKSLCGNMGNETELVMSGKMDGARDAVMLAAEVIDNRALTSLDISNQVNRWGEHSGIGAEGAKYLAGALKDHA